MSDTIKNHASFIWSVADLLRNDFRPSQYGAIMLPFVALRRLDCVLEATKPDVIAAAQSLPQGIDDAMRHRILAGAAKAGGHVFNTNPFTFETLKAQSPGALHVNLINYITSFPADVVDIFMNKFEFSHQLKKLAEAKLLYKVFSDFCTIDLHPDKVSNLEMGYLFEELIRRFSENSNETAGEHFTPREVVRLVVDLLMAGDADVKNRKPGLLRKIYDPTCGTGGMLSISEEELRAATDGKAATELYGQEINAESYAICKADMLVKGHNPSRIAHGNTLTEDGHANEKFHWMIANPPYGVEWKKFRETIEEEAKAQATNNRFTAGLPRISDGQLLFLQHMLSKRHASGSRIGVVFNGSPLFTGGAGSGESEIRRWILENDWLEAIVALPTDIFYNTNIQTYVWLLATGPARSPERRGKVQLIDASGEAFWKAMRKSLGNKRREIHDDGRALVCALYESAQETDASKIFSTFDFAYREVRIEQPLRLKFTITEEGLFSLAETRAFQKLSRLQRSDVIDHLRNILGGQVFMSRDSFLTAMEKAFDHVAPMTQKTPGKSIGPASFGESITRSMENFSENIQILFGDKPKTTFMKEAISIFGETDPDADICYDSKGNPEPDTKLRDYESIPLKEDWVDYFKREVRPFAPEAWVDENYTDERDEQIGRVGYEINFNQHFQKYTPQQAVEDIDANLRSLEREIADLLAKVVK
jgi:type I restriction enzyme M protein